MMQPQVDPAGRAFRSPGFAAYYTQRLHELRVRLAYVCRTAWDVNAAWLLRHDVSRIMQQLRRDHGDADLGAWQALGSQLDAAIELPVLPSSEIREGILAAFRHIDIATAIPESRQPSVRTIENGRVEVPPPAFWRRWAHDAGPATYSDAANEEALRVEAAQTLDLEHADIDAIIAAGKVGTPSLEIVQERIASSPEQAPEKPTSVADPSTDDFINSSSEAPPRQGDYDWGLDSTKARGDQSLDAFWEATTPTPAPSVPAPATPAVASVAVEPASRVPPSTTSPVVAPIPAPTPEQAPTQTPVPAQAPASSVSVAPVPPTPVVAATPTPVAAPVVHAPSAAAAPAPARPVPQVKSPVAKPAPMPAPVPVAATMRSGAGQRIYHLTDSNDLACELDQRLEQLDYELELLESAEELQEVLGALTPNLVLVDAPFRQDLTDIGSALRVARQRSSDPIRLLVVCEADTMEVRLAARRAGADGLVVDPQTSDAVIARIEQVLHDVEVDRYRVLVVEDDRAQGLFAESILRNAGMEAEVVEDGLKVMEALRRFQPDLVLMDLYMPDCNGAELTALIREDDEFVNTPIVFLSGESDQDKTYEALSAGADDFLSKPIRPKYLIATVNNRIRRARAVRARAAPVVVQETFDSGTGLHFRAAMLEKLERALLEAEPAQRQGGLLFVGIEEVPALRQRLGLTVVEELLEDVAQFIVAHMGAGTLACRYGDACFLLFDPHSDSAQLQVNAEQIRDTIAFHPFDTPKETVTLKAVVGVAELREPYTDAAAVLNAAEHASRGTIEAEPTAVVAPMPPQDSARAAHVAALLVDAIEQGRLDLDYQPIIALQSDAQAQYQTLVRLRQADGNDVTAGEILPVLRAQGRVAELDRWVLQRAMEVVATRLAIAKPVTLFVSQAVATMCQPGYPEWLAEQLQGAGRIGASLVIEISVDEIQLELATVQAMCSSLLAHGVRFCLSRFGASEDQTSVLNVLPVDLVKVAPDLVAKLGSSERRAEFGALVEDLHE
ncbi:MAG: response regulator, partial [Xanthomonadales bacterium]|nr:response regulator [Xanthomonadales bacterium]